MLATAVLALFLGSTGAKGQVSDRRVRWLTLQTEHFDISYPEPTGAVARRAAFIAERAHQRLSEVLGHDPEGRTQIVLNDQTDSANGSATSLPYNQMELFVTAPEDLTPLGDYDDWLSVLITHEHTHVLHLDTIHGWPALVNAVLGKVYAPNLIQPRWFIEGLATHMESAETAGGRIRSTMFEMYMRMDVLEDRVLRIDQLSSSVDRWPRGTSWYLYGGRFVDWIAREYGREALTAMSHEYGRRLIPYGVNRTARRVTGRTFIELYDDWQRDMRERYGALRERIVSEGRVEGERLTFHAEIARAPRFIDDDTLVYYVNDGQNDTQLRLVSLDGSNPRQLTRVVGESYADVTNGGRTIVYDSLDGHRDIYFLYDLFSLDRGERGDHAPHPRPPRPGPRCISQRPQGRVRAERGGDHAPDGRGPRRRRGHGRSSDAQRAFSSGLHAAVVTGRAHHRGEPMDLRGLPRHRAGRSPNGRRSPGHTRPRHGHRTDVVRGRPHSLLLVGSNRHREPLRLRRRERKPLADDQRDLGGVLTDRVPRWGNHRLSRLLEPGLRFASAARRPHAMAPRDALRRRPARADSRGRRHRAERALSPGSHALPPELPARLLSPTLSARSSASRSPAATSSAFTNTRRASASAWSKAT